MAEIPLTTKQGNKQELPARVREWWTKTGRVLAPGRRAWQGAIWGAASALLLILAVIAYGLFGQVSWSYLLAGFALLTGVIAGAGGLLMLLWRIFRGMPARYVWILGSSAVLLAYVTMMTLSVPLGILAVGGGTLLVASLLGAAVAEVRGGGWREATSGQRVLIAAALVAGSTGLVAGGAWLLDPGSPLLYPPGVQTLAETDVPLLEMPDPSQPGAYPVQTLFYGSGADVQRPEYGAAVDLVTQAVDGSALVEGWSGLRTRYWGFGPEALPLNGRVWYPEGEGPFPLLLMVHGQHPMEDYSDPGYAYLGELLASRGFIAVSVDENFLNLSPLADVLVLKALTGADDLRAWLLLEHLRAWREWNEEPASPFYQQVDMEQIALMGHSRGGQAVAVAALFNQLAYYPEDASVVFDYGFQIQALIALAPTDGTYKPAGQDIELQDVSYLVLHGAHDMDVFTFQGSQQYARVGFDEESDRFKAALYIYGANHGQFNTSWGRKDLFEPIMRVYNLEQLMAPEDQRQVAKVALVAFLEATLHGNDGYRPLFQDIRRGRAWLPDTVYLHQYADAATEMVSSYEEDADLASTTLPGGSITGDNLTVWREQPVQAKWETFNSQAVYLGWDVASAPGLPRYRIRLPQQRLSLTQESVLVFALAAAGSGDSDFEPIELTVEVADAAGEISRLPLSHFAPLYPQIEAQLGKAAFMSVLPESEAVLQHFEFSLRDFVAQNGKLDAAELVEVRFIFDGSPAGEIVLDDLGFRNDS